MQDDISRLPTHDEMVAQVERVIGRRLTDDESHRLLMDEVVRRMNHPDEIAKVKAEIAEAERKLAEYKAADPALYAEFESWYEAHARKGSVPSVGKRD